MKNIILAFSLLFSLNISSQKVGINTLNPSVTLDVNGALRIGNDNNTSPAGTIRFNPETGDFEGFDGNEWISFRPIQPWPNQGDWGSVHNYFHHAPTDVIQGDEYGYAVDIHSNYAVIGSPGWMGQRGRVLVIKKVGFQWVVKDTLTSPLVMSERFGHSVAIWGDHLVVGAPFHFYNFGGTDYSFGAVYIYKKEGENWQLIKTLINDIVTATNLGESVDIQNLDVIAGAVKNDPVPFPHPNTNSGHVLMYDIATDATYVIHPPSVSATGINQFGKSVSIYNQWLVVGAPCSNCTTVTEDSVYVYLRPLGSTFAFDHTITGIVPGIKFGYSLQMTENLMIIGSPGFEGTLDAKQGRATIYTYDNNLSKWTPSNIYTGTINAQEFGNSVCSHYPYLISVAKYSNIYADPLKVLYKNDNTISPYVHISDPLSDIGNNYVNDVSIHGGYFIVGYPHGYSPSGTSGGRIFIGRVR